MSLGGLGTVVGSDLFEKTRVVLFVFCILLGSSSIRVIAEIFEIFATGLSLGKVVLGIQHVWAHDLVEVLLAYESCAVSIKASFVFRVHFFAVIHYRVR